VRASNAGGDGPWSDVEATTVRPSAPFLSPISNPDGDGDYLVDWISSQGATTYTLQVDGSASFGSPATVYQGAASQHAVTGQPVGTWYYRVNASNAAGDSSWSNTESVGVYAPPRAVVLTGPSSGLAGVSNAFTATVSPITTSLPLTYVWRATDQIPVTHTGGLNDDIVFAWSTPGAKAITATARNPRGAVVDTHVITINAPPVSVAIGGPTAGAPDAVHTFTATVNPSATQPLTYVWQATGQPSTTHVSGLSDVIAFTWGNLGPKTITVTARNPLGVVTATHAFAVGIPPEHVEINGRTTGVIGAGYTFMAAVSPETAMLPLTYVWQATEQSPVTHTGGLDDDIVFVWDTPGFKTITVTVSNVGGTANASHTITITQAGPGDAYEDDDTCLQASVIPTNGTIQPHTFHDQADEDWIAFQATTGITYVIQIRVPAASPADVVAEFYGDCGAAIQPGQDPAFSPDIRLTVQLPADGTYHLRLLNHAPDVYGPEVAYDVSVRALTTTVNPGALVIVAGRLYSDDSRDLQQNIQNITNGVYRLFRAKNYPPERIYYLATDLSIDADGDGIPDVNGLASKANLEYAITQWTADKELGPERAFSLYLMDHGGLGGIFYLDKPRNQWVTAQELAGWLSQLETGAPGVKTNVIVEACYSGGFINPNSLVLADLMHLLQTVSGPERVVIASTDAIASAYASPDGAWFSDAFLDALARDMSLAEAFDEGANTARQANPAQIAWLDGDGDGIPNEQADYQAAAFRGFAFAGTFADDKWPPYVKQFEVRNLDRGQGEIWAEVRDDLDVSGVWAVVYPPSYTPPTSGDALIPSPLPVALFSQGNDQYGVLYTSFDEIGEYRVVIYAQDNEGLQARPKEVLVRTGWPVYLPLVIRAH
jgi:hypothetical protein